MRLNETIQQLADAVGRIESNIESLQTDVKGIRERASRDRDQMEMLKNQIQGFMVLGGGDRGSEPPRYVPTGTGLIDPEWRWEREHPFRR